MSYSTELDRGRWSVARRLTALMLALSILLTGQPLMPVAAAVPVIPAARLLSVLVSNGDFSAGSTGWSSSGSVGFAGEMVGFSGSDTPINGILWQQVNTVAGKAYQLSYDVERIGPGAGTPQLLVEVVDVGTSTVLASTVSAGNIEGVFVHYSLNFTAQGPVIVRFTDQSTSTISLDVGLDNVMVSSAPVAVADSYRTNQNTMLNTPAAGVLTNDTDAESDPLSAALVGNPTHGNVVLNADGSFAYTPTTGFGGYDRFTYKANDGSLDSNVTTATVSVVRPGCVPQYPGLVGWWAAEGDATDSAGSNPGYLYNGASYTTGKAGQAFTFNGASQSMRVTHTTALEMRNNLTVLVWFKVDSLAALANAKVFSKRTGVHGPYEISVYNDGTTITAYPMGSTDDVSWDVSITTNPTITLGSWHQAAFVMDSSNLHSFYLNGQLKGTKQMAAPLMAHETADFLLGIDAGGSFPLNGAVDEAMIFNRALADWEIKAIYRAGSAGTCAEPNTAPVATADSYTLDEDMPLNIAAAGVLTNDLDADGNPIYAHSRTSPSHGVVSLYTSGAFIYTPTANYNGPDTFTYRISDTVLLSSYVTVSLNINSVNDAPAATGDSYTTDYDTALAIPAPGLLTNDSDPVEGSSLTAVKVTDPAHGAVTVNADGSFVYTPTTGYRGNDSFTYQANDGTDDSNVVTVDITVLPPVGEVGLIGYWKFDEGSGTTAADASGSGLTGRLSGGASFTTTAAPVTAYANPGSISMITATSGLVTMTNSAVNQLTNNMTVMGWVRPGRVSGYQRIIGSARTRSSNGWNFGIWSNSLVFSAYGRKDYYPPFSPGLKAGQWYHIAAVMDISNTVTFYINGLSIGSVTGTLPLQADTDDVLQLGAATASLSTTLTDPYFGLIDDLRVYNRALNQTEIADLVGVAPCSELMLRARIMLGETLPSKTISLDGSCTYTMTFADSAVNGGSGAYLGYATTIEGNGATLVRDPAAPMFRLLTTVQPITIRNLTLRGGKVYGSGGAIMTFDNITLTNVRFENNATPNTPGSAYVNVGGALSAAKNVTVNRCTFINNQAGGWGAAISFNGTGASSIVNSVFADNLAGSAGAAIRSTTITGTLTLVNNTFAEQYKNSQEAVLLNGSATLLNNIFYNYKSGFTANSAVTVTEDYNLYAANDLEPQSFNGAVINRGGHSRIAALPRFVDAAAGNYRLQSNSPAIDLGTDAGIATDADGNTRPYGPAADMGAYEYPGPGVPSVSIVKMGPPYAAGTGQTEFIITVINEGSAPLNDLRIVDQLPAGATYVSGTAAYSGTLNGGSLVWDLAPLAPNQMARVWYMVTATQTLVSNNYSVSSISVPTITASGPTITTPYDVDYTALGFNPFPDGYNFANWGAPTLDTDITPADMPVIYGTGVCKTQSPCVLSAAAEADRQIQAAKSSGGHCGGMAMSSMWIFDRPDVVAGTYQPGALNTFDLTKANARNLIVNFHATQAMNPANTAGLSPYTAATGASGVVNTLLANFANPNAGNRYTLWFFKADWTGGHAVVPYAVKKWSNDSYWIYVYDVNYPNNYNRVFKVTMSTNSWVYEGAAINPDAPASTYTGTNAISNTIQIKSLRWAERFPKVCTSACVPDPVKGLTTTLSSAYEFQLEGEGYLMVTRNDGLRAGFDAATGQFISEIPGAEVIVNPTGLLNIPGGIRIPHVAGATYALRISDRPNVFGNMAATADVNILGDGFVTRLTGLKIDSAEDPAQSGSNDVIGVTFDGDSHLVTYKSSALDSDTPALGMAVSQRNAPDYTFKVDGGDLPSGRSLTAALDPTTGKLSIENDDPASNSYSLDVEKINLDGSKLTYHSDVITDGTGVGAVLDLGSSWITGTPSIAQNNGPVSVGDSYVVNINSVYTVAAPGVLSNDSNPTGGALTATLIATPTHGTVTLNADGSFVYTPTVGYAGPDSFTYQAGNGVLSTNATTVTIMVRHVVYLPIVMRNLVKVQK